MAKDVEKPARETQQQRSEAQQSHQKEGGSKSSQSKGNGSKGENEIVQMMRAQHQTLESALEKRNQNGDVGSVVREFAMAWIPHDDIEIELLYPAMMSGGVEVETLAESVIRHDIINLVLADLLGQPEQNSARSKLQILAAEYGALQSMEERLGDVSERVELASEASPDLLERMKERHEARKGRLERAGDNFGAALSALASRSLSVRSMSQHSRRENEMQRNQSYRDRDEQGRFLPEEERGGRGYERESRGRFEDMRREDMRRYEDDDRDERRARSRYDEDERYRGEEPGRGRRGGWFGDSEGHSEAARRAWRTGRHGESGWFGDSEGHSEASRRGWRSGHHGESGWFGDPEGHSQASRRGWEEREGDYRQGNGNELRSRSRFSEDDRHRGGRYEEERYRGREDEGRGRGHGGWFGDPEGHSMASRRGWEEREGGEYRSRERDDEDRDRRRSRYDH